MQSVTRTIFPVFAFKVTHRVILLIRFCKLLTIVAILSWGGGHVPQVPQWHVASAGKNGLALFSSVTIPHEAKITDIKMKRKKNKKQQLQNNRTLN